MNVLIITYNVAGINPINLQDKFELFFNFINEYDVDLIILGF